MSNNRVQVATFLTGVLLFVSSYLLATTLTNNLGPAIFMQVSSDYWARSGALGIVLFASIVALLLMFVDQARKRGGETGNVTVDGR